MVTVTLRPLEDGDLDRIFAWESDPASVRQAAFTRPDPGDRSAFDAHYARILADRDVLLRAVLTEGRLAATVASFTMEDEREVTYWVDPAQRGLGIASAALAALLELDHTRPLFARVADHNSSSAKVLTHCGFTQIGTERSYADGVGHEIDERIFRLDGTASSGETNPAQPAAVGPQVSAGPATTR
ncbi:GNAT family N-acetyltransferase [Arthrobacter sp. Soil736]|uniref:GNAT family N-acetyltransferase n=1 Tax=Arthrobacter sp. Soil736 TaxID=1736395 RepID=UPI0009E8ED53|nr:GNAT family N-acetyltransferase [Arthrobacter sp. Soil736]